MRTLLFVPFVLLAACPKDKTTRCNSLEAILSPGSDYKVYADVCNAGPIGKLQVSDHSEGYVAWWNLAPGLFSINGMPWYLEYRFSEPAPMSNEDPVLYLIADPHAPFTVFHGEYEYQLSLSSESTPNRGAVIVQVERTGGRYSFNAQVLGNGSITNAFITCGLGNEQCEASVAQDEQLSFEALPDAGYVFSHVEGCNLTARDAGGTTVLEGTATEDMSCIAVFVPDNGNMLLNIDIDGGNGAVTVDFGQSTETLTDQESYSLAPGTQVTLTAVDVAPFEFRSWLGDCAGAGRAVQVTLDDHKSCTAHFEQVVVEGYALNVMIQGMGEVRIGNQACNSEVCPTYQATAGEVVDLVATPANQYMFMGWGGDCPGTDPSISVTVNSQMSCTATFMPNDCGSPVVGRIDLLDMATGAVIGSSLDTQCSLTSPQGQAFTLKAEGFSSTAGSLIYNWDTTYQGPGDPVEFDQYGQSISVTKFGTGCQGIFVQAVDVCGQGVDTFIGITIQ